MRVRALMSVVAAVGLAATLASCGSDDDGAAATNGETAGGDCKIALLLPENTDARYETRDRPYFEEEVAERAPECEVLYFNAGHDATKQQQQAETALTQGADVLVLNAVDQASAATIVERAKAKDVPTIAHDRVSEGPVALRVTFDNEKVGELQGQALIEAMKANNDTSGDIVMINGTPSSSGSQAFKRGAHSVIDDSGFTVAAEYDTQDWSPDLAATQMSQAITKIGKDRIKGVYVANDTMAGAAINSMRQARMDPLPPVTGQDAEPAGLQRILLGTQAMTVYKPLRPLAEHSAEAAIALAKGEPVKDATQKESNEDYEYPVILLEPVSVTRDNIKDTVLDSGFVTADEICTDETRATCEQLGLTG